MFSTSSKSKEYECCQDIYLTRKWYRESMMMIVMILASSNTMGRKELFPLGFESRTLYVWSARANHYTTKSTWFQKTTILTKPMEEKKAVLLCWCMIAKRFDYVDGWLIMVTNYILVFGIILEGKLIPVIYAKHGQCADLYSSKLQKQSIRLLSHCKQKIRKK